MGERRAVRLVFFFSKTRVVRRSAHTTRKWEVPSRKLQPTKTKLRLGWSNVLIISKVKKKENHMTWKTEHFTMMHFYKNLSSEKVENP